VGRSSESETSARGAALRSSKDRIIGMVARECEARELRALAGGGTVFAMHGLISPLVSRSVSFIVAPADLAGLVHALREKGWVRERTTRWLSPLPGAITRLTHEGWPASLDLHAVIPGFFEDPEISFEHAWSHQTSAEINGVRVPILDKLGTVIFAAHDRLAGDKSRRSPDTNLEFFLDQFRVALSAKECRALLRRVRDLGASEELRPLLEGLGLDPGEPVLPSLEYTAWRTGLPSATIADACLMGVIELPNEQRWALIREKVRFTPRGLFRAARAAVISFARLRQAPQRLAKALD